MKIKNIKIINLFIAVVIFSLAACNSYKEPIKIGINNWPSCELWIIAQEKGYFGDTPVEIVRFSTWTDSLNSLYMGRTDLTSSTDFNTVYYSSRGEAAKIILSSETINGVEGLVIKDYVEGIQDLKGRRIAVEVGTDEHFLLYKVLSRRGLSEEDVTIVSVDSEEGMRRFIAGEVDASFNYEPFLSMAADRGEGRIVATTSDTLNYNSALVARDKVLQERKEDYVNIIKAWYRAQEFVRDNPQEAYELMASKEGTTYEDFKEFYESFYFFTLEENKAKFSSENFRGGLRKIEEFLAGNNLISAQVDTDNLYDGSVVNSIGGE